LSAGNLVECHLLVSDPLAVFLVDKVIEHLIIRNHAPFLGVGDENLAWLQSTSLFDLCRVGRNGTDF
jgi:hypothetical protein